MTLLKAYTHFYQRFMPSPLVLAVVLTFLAVLFAVIFGENTTIFSALAEVLMHWQNGIWDASLLTFAMQMLLVLVLGHALALSPILDKWMHIGIAKLTNASQAAASIAFFTMLFSYFNWGLGLIFGAVFCRKVAEHFFKQNVKFNYPLLGAAAYTGMMVWHGGISGSATSKSAENGHLQSMLESKSAALPVSLGFDQTVFALPNLLLFAFLLVVIPMVFYYMAKFEQMQKHNNQMYQFDKLPQKPLTNNNGYISLSKPFAIFVGASLTFLTLENLSIGNAIFSLNNINLALLFFGLLAHNSLKSFSLAVDEAVKGVGGIIIQFPLYFGILSILRDSGVLSQFSLWIAQNASAHSLPFITFYSAALVNIFIPSGGGQWVLQAPIILELATTLDVSISKVIMAFCYGDQLTNMLQPFWALPLLGITKIKAASLLPYCFVIFLIGLFSFNLCIWFF